MEDEEIMQTALAQNVHVDMSKCAMNWICLHGTGCAKPKRLEKHDKQTLTANSHLRMSKQSSLSAVKQNTTTTDDLPLQQEHLQTHLHTKLGQERDRMRGIGPSVPVELKSRTDTLNEIQPASADNIDFPPAIASGSLVSFPGKRRLCLFGGIADKIGCSNDTWIYELGLQKWKKVEFEGREKSSSTNNISSRADMLNYTLNNVEITRCILPKQRCGHVAVGVGQNEMLVFGGQNVSQVQYFDDLWTLKLEPTPQWKMVCPSGNIPRARWYSSAVFYDDQLFVYGGEGENYELIKDVSVYSRTDNRWLNLRTIYPYPNARMLHSACIVEESMIIVGGVGKDEMSTADVWKFDLRMMTWKEIVTTGRSPFDTKEGGKKTIYGHTCSVWGNRVIVYGGRHVNNINGSVWILDLDSNKWTELSGQWKTGYYPSHRWKHMITTDHYSHVSSKSYRAEDRRHLEELALHQHNKTLKRSDGDVSTQQPAEVLLQKLSRTYIFGGAGPSKKYGDLWEFTVSLNRSV